MHTKRSPCFSWSPRPRAALAGEDARALAVAVVARHEHAAAGQVADALSTALARPLPPGSCSNLVVVQRCQAAARGVGGRPEQKTTTQPFMNVAQPWQAKPHDTECCKANVPTKRIQALINVGMLNWRVCSDCSTECNIGYNVTISHMNYKLWHKLPNKLPIKLQQQ